LLLNPFSQSQGLSLALEMMASLLMCFNLRRIAGECEIRPAAANNPNTRHFLIAERGKKSFHSSSTWRDLTGDNIIGVLRPELGFRVIWQRCTIGIFRSNLQSLKICE